ncbi:MAG: SRPBCC family protein [Acidimicrobiia bacterium]|nr:SRPBCC family protein [Acidimicrobiia bacterium]
MATADPLTELADRSKPFHASSTREQAGSRDLEENRYTLRREQVLPLPVARVFSFFARVSNLETITPPWLSFRVLSKPIPECSSGITVDYWLRWRGLPIRWRTQITTWDPPRQFQDVQLAGPYRHWEHTHFFEAIGQETRMTDVLRYSLPFGALGKLVHWLVVARDLEAIFDYRAKLVASLLGAEGNRASES